MINKTTLFSFTIALILIACSNDNPNNKSNSEKVAFKEEQAIVDSNVLKVYVEKNGKITADGNEISLTRLDSSFNKLKASYGTVYYSRANGEGDPPEESMRVIELIAKYRLPIKLFTDKTFTVLVKPN